MTPNALLLFIIFSTICTLSLSATNSSTLPQDAVALLSFQEKADENNILNYSSSGYHCNWQGVKCTIEGKVVKYVVENLNLRGFFAQDSLTHLDQLEVLSLHNNSLFGPIPNLSPLVNLRTLILNHNNFSGSFPLSVLNLDRLIVLSLSHNNLAGSLPARLTLLKRLISLHLESNHFTGLVPALNQTRLRVFDISDNNLVGLVPETETLSRFKPASFEKNPGLCGELVRRQCPHHSVVLIIILVIFIFIFIAIIVIALMKRKPMATGFGVLKQQMEMVPRDSN